MFWIAWTATLVAKLILASTLAPFGDEAWYWQESRQLAVGYSDLPPATAWLIAVGEALFGHGVLAMRAPFLLLGALLPLLMVGVGRRVFDEAAGWCAGLFALGLPLLGTLGVFALPDVPLTFLAALALDAGERATRTRRTRDFALLGGALAAAWLVHYRAAMLLFTGCLFFVATARGRALLRTSGPWLACGISALGLIPILLFNARHDWIGFGFQFVDRHPWSFHADALIQPLEQAIACTPLFYALLLWAAARICLRFVRSEQPGASTSPAARAAVNLNEATQAPWDLFACAAVVPLVAYFAIGCFADDTRFRLHWPLPGYLPLLIVLPVLLRTVRLRGFVTFAVAMLVAGDVVAQGYLVMAAVPGGAVALARVKAFPEHLVGWHEAATQTRELLARAQFADDVLVADNFMLAAELDFAFDGQREIYALDQPINAKHGRAAQLALWQRDEAGLDALGPRQVLLVSEPTARREREREPWMTSLCSRVADVVPVAQLDLYDGRKRFRWYAGTVPPSARTPVRECAAKP